MKTPGEICETCKKPVTQCQCCAECGHICSLDYGELYCQVCFPDPFVKKQNGQ